MSEFCEDIFDSAHDLTVTQNLVSRILPSNCDHSAASEVNGLWVCSSCGIESDILLFNSEWKGYDSNVQSRIAAPHGNNRESSLIRELRAYGINDSVINLTMKKFFEVVGKKTVRNDRRKSIIAVCLLFAYREHGENRTIDDVRKLFNLDRKKVSSARREYYSHFKNDMLSEITPEHLLHRILVLTQIPFKHYLNLQAIARSIKNASTTLIRSNPQSVASGITFFYLLTYAPNLLNTFFQNDERWLTNFAEKLDLSEITVKKLTKEVKNAFSSMIPLMESQARAQTHEQIHMQPIAV